MVNPKQRIDLEREYHESYDRKRDANPLIVSAYASDLFAEAEFNYAIALGTLAGAHVVDYGCGTGETAKLFCQQGAKVTGFDLSHRRLSEAHTNYASMGARFIQCAAEYLPFANESVDAVLGRQILHHLDLTVAIPEVVRVLRKGGRAVFLEPLGHNPLLEAYRALTPHLRSPTERALRMTDLDYIASYFSSWRHSEFCLLSVIPFFLDHLTGEKLKFSRLSPVFRRADKWLQKGIPFLGRYFWQSVIILEK